MSADTKQVGGSHYKDNSDELWRPIPGWDGLYEASNHGRIRSVRRMLPGPIGRKSGVATIRAYGGKVLAPKRCRNGYASVNLWRQNVGRMYDVHRLVCMTFWPSISEGLEVNHKDGNRLNNAACNLEWVTRRQNLKHAEMVLGTKMVWTIQKERAAQKRGVPDECK